VKAQKSAPRRIERDRTSGKFVCVSVEREAFVIMLPSMWGELRLVAGILWASSVEELERRRMGVPGTHFQIVR